MTGTEAGPQEEPVSRFYLIVTFWGPRYRAWFTRYALASLLAPNNIPSLDHRERCRFLICTTGEDWEALQDHPLMERLREMITPVFVRIADERPGTHKYRRMTDGHVALTRRCFQDKACAIYVAPDTIVPDGCLAELQRLARQGVRAVLCTAIRFDLEGVQDELVRRGIMRPGTALVLARREAVAVGLANLHPEARAGNYDAANFGELSPEHGRTDFPTCCYFEVAGEQGVVIHTHNWAPFMMNFAALDHHDSDALERWAIDGDYIYRNFTLAALDDHIHVVQDSDRIILIGLTPRREMVPPETSHPMKSLRVLGDWTKGYIINRVVHDRQTDPLRRTIYRRPVLWHAKDINENWQAVKARAHDIMAMYASVDLHPLKIFSRRKTAVAEAGRWRMKRALEYLWISIVLVVMVPLLRWSSRLRLLLWSYVDCMIRALWGDAVERERIRMRFRRIMGWSGLGRKRP